MKSIVLFILGIALVGCAPELPAPRESDITYYGGSKVIHTARDPRKFEIIYTLDGKNQLRKVMEADDVKLTHWPSLQNERECVMFATIGKEVPWGCIHAWSKNVNAGRHKSDGGGGSDFGPQFGINPATGKVGIGFGVDGINLIGP